MKRVLIIPSWYPSIQNPGLGTFFREQAELLVDEFEIRILCSVIRRKIPRWKKLLNTVAYILFKKITFRAKNDYFLIPPPVFGFEYENGINQFRKINYRISIETYIIGFKSLIGNWKPDVIHSHDTFIGGIVAYNINKIYNIPYIITEHNYLQFKYESYIRKDFIKAIEKACKMLVVSEYQKRNLLMYDVECNPEVIGNYVNDSIFTLSKEQNSRGTFNILYVGRYAQHKDFKTLINTIYEFDSLTNDKNYCFTIIGNMFNQKDKIIKQIKELYSESRIKIYEFVARDSIVDFFHLSDVFLSTSIAETFGVGMCEAMMCGIPVVSTNNGGFDEMYIPGVNGIKTKIGDYKNLASALYKIQTGEITFNSDEIRKSVINKFGTEAFKSKMMSIYNSINE